MPKQTYWEKEINVVGNYVIFQCRKCAHLLYATFEWDTFKKMPERGCPECGEEGENWILYEVKDITK